MLNIHSLIYRQLQVFYTFDPLDTTDWWVKLLINLVLISDTWLFRVHRSTNWHFRSNDCQDTSFMTLHKCKSSCINRLSQNHYEMGVQNAWLESAQSAGWRTCNIVSANAHGHDNWHIWLTNIRCWAEFRIRIWQNSEFSECVLRFCGSCSLGITPSHNN